MSLGSSTNSYPAFDHIGLRENSGKTSTRKHAVENGSTRRVDILAYNADTKKGIIVDPTIRFEVGCHQSAEVHLEKKSIYEPTVNYFKLKYALIHAEVFGLLIGARGTIPAFFEEFRRQFALPTSLRDDIVIITTLRSRRFPDRIVPDRRMFMRMFDILRVRGTLPSGHIVFERQSEQVVNELENTVQIISYSPTTSSRRLSVQFGIPQTRAKRTSVSSIHHQHVQHIHKGDVKRQKFCQKIM
ncbi:hypothetical protein ANN_18462 [Periplaneta americana]|uniref:Uncharacterized protein n=1 Tax=Periplaneta americana TaxID=6978 RepID=A0ABQ8SPG7_PERAM|nr:hypothetical protein ANN_18462 [Periplaneta americana]